MDHLLRPQDCIDLGIELRYLCDDTDFVDFAAFPTRHGMTLNSQGRLSIEELHQHRRLREAHFLQAWLFFGTLKECFGNDFHLDDYIATLETSQHKLVHTRGLGEMLTRKDNHLLRLKATDAEAEKQERDRLHNLILHVAQCCAELDRWHDPENFDPEWAIVLLSVKLLIQSLDLDARLDRQLHKPHHVDDPSFAPLRTAMLKKRGWCSHHVQELGSANTYHALFYLASLRRYPGQWIDHSFCEATDQCTAYNVNELTHRVLHVEEGVTVHRSKRLLPIWILSTLEVFHSSSATERKGLHPRYHTGLSDQALNMLRSLTSGLMGSEIYWQTSYLNVNLIGYLIGLKLSMRSIDQASCLNRFSRSTNLFGR